MNVAFGTDEVTSVTEALKAALQDWGHDVKVLADPLPWPVAGRVVAESVADGRCRLGVVCCWTGTGVSIAANKVPGVRAALCGDAETARGARRWNDANVVAISLRLASEAMAREIVDAFVTTPPDGGEAPMIALVEPADGPE